MSALFVFAALLVAIQFAGMAWAYTRCRKVGVDGPAWWRVFLVVAWPLTALLNWIGRVQ